jgi:putative SOS response-associated peptidase YedK
MCGRYTLTKAEIKELAEYYGLSEEDVKRLYANYKPRFNVAPTDVMPVITFDGRHNRVDFKRWGLIPEWAKDEKSGFSMINARDDTLHEKPAFKELIARNRCLVPADSFYEWRKEGQVKQPLRFILKDKGLFSFAGLHTRWVKRQDGTEIRSFTIITCKPNKIVEPIHDRMPVILPKEAEKDWLDPGLTSIKDVRKFFVSLDDGKMTSYEVNRAVNSVKNQSENLIEPLERDEGKETGELSLF